MKKRPAEIEISQIINQKTRLSFIILQVIPLNTPGWARSGRAIAIVFVLSLDLIRLEEQQSRRKRAFNVITLHNGLEKWSYASTRRPATDWKVITEKIAWLLMLHLGFTFDINQCENNISCHIKLLNQFSALAFLNHTIPIINSGKWAMKIPETSLETSLTDDGQEKFQKHHWEYPQQKHCISLLAFSL